MKPAIRFVASSTLVLFLVGVPLLTAGCGGNPGPVKGSSSKSTEDDDANNAEADDDTPLPVPTDIGPGDVIEADDDTGPNGRSPTPSNNGPADDDDTSNGDDDDGDDDDDTDDDTSSDDDQDTDDDANADDDDTSPAADDDSDDDTSPEDDDAASTDDDTSTPEEDPYAFTGPCFGTETMRVDGEISTVEHVQGNDDLYLDVRDGQVALKVGRATDLGEFMGERFGTLVAFYAGFEETEVNGQETCLPFTHFVFSYNGGPPVTGQEVAYHYDEEPVRGVLSADYPVRFFVDINAARAVQNPLEPAYVGVEGSFTFTEANVERDDAVFHTVSFDVLFVKVTDDALDPSTNTRLAGHFEFSTQGTL